MPAGNETTERHLDVAIHALPEGPTSGTMIVRINHSNTRQVELKLTTSEGALLSVMVFREELAQALKLNAVLESL